MSPDAIIPSRQQKVTWTIEVLIGSASGIMLSIEANTFEGVCLRGVGWLATTINLYASPQKKGGRSVVPEIYMVPSRMSCWYQSNDRKS